ncbi:hypothetical protein [Natronorubrum texcoconense]|uniref:Uncharacterized protein n=1 Tax=Natronorubrum texcoconense TaxID=1095776 RepID=A0A1G8Y837_9EURY|nr:hypothetical protein [Natronorubrum texcoconense]SDJ98972.1 hypothetical protein SAMN04515672_2062 [Natronorubrum texcoconense]
MNQLVWVLAMLYVVLGAGLFYGLAIGSTTIALATGVLLAALAVPQWIVLSKYGGQVREPGSIPRDRT